HAKRQHIGWDVRAKKMLSEAYHDHSVQDMHLSSTYRKNRRHQRLLEGKPSCSGSLERSASEPCGVTLGASAHHAPFKPVWELKEALPPLSGPSNMSPLFSPASPTSRDGHNPMESTISFLQDSLKNDYCGELRWNTKWAFQRRPDGGFWMR
ncbi:unnamed protein product, partial [Symbiodinium pilosum]